MSESFIKSLIQELKFDDRGLIPAVVQDCDNHEVLMMAYMNREALEKTMETGMAHYWSRSRQKLWLKGETSGHFQTVKSIKPDCDSDTLLLEVEQKEAACHTGHRSCFFREMKPDGTVEAAERTVPGGEKEAPAQKKTPAGNEADAVGTDAAGAGVLQDVYDVIVDRTQNPREGSYTNYLFEKGLDKMLKKVGEEAAEVIIAAKNRSKEELTYEIADLNYHLLVVMVESGLTLDDIYQELRKRR